MDRLILTQVVPEHDAPARLALDRDVTPDRRAIVSSRLRDIAEVTKWPDIHYVDNPYLAVDPRLNQGQDPPHPRTPVQRRIGQSYRLRPVPQHSGAAAWQNAQGQDPSPAGERCAEAAIGRTRAKTSPDRVNTGTAAISPAPVMAWGLCWRGPTERGSAVAFAAMAWPASASCGFSVPLRRTGLLRARALRPCRAACLHRKSSPAWPSNSLARLT